MNVRKGLEAGKLYWHFCALAPNGVPITREGYFLIVGKRYRIRDEPELCVRGFHGSAKVLNALDYAPGPWVSLRPLKNVVHGLDKVVGKSYKQGPGFDATETLKAFGRWCALEVADIWEAPNVVKQYLKTNDASLREAALSAGRTPPHSNPHDNRIFAWYTWVFAQGSRWAAARATAMYASRVADWETQNTKLTEMLLEAGPWKSN